ncbi:MAG: 50S ribosomal protein L10 [Flavobacteriales bacterium]|nr:50S ribosomal protein L10 [Flavobacteriales bacterium]
MTRAEKEEIVKHLSQKLNENSIFYLADISDLDAETSTKLRRLAHKREVSLNVVKNTLLRKALEAAEGSYEQFYDLLKGNTSIMFSEVGNAPAKLIKEFRKDYDRPILKGAFIEEAVFIGDDQVKSLAEMKSKEEVIADIIAILQSPAKNVVSALQSGGNTISGLVKALGERAE